MSSKPFVNEPTRYDKWNTATTTTISDSKECLWFWFVSARYGLAWCGAVSSVAIRCVYACLLSLTLRYLPQQIITQNIECDTYAHMRHSTWLIVLLYMSCLARTLHTKTQTFTAFIHPFLTLSPTTNSFALLYAPCVSYLFSICCWLKLKLGVCVCKKSKLRTKLCHMKRRRRKRQRRHLIRFPKVKKSMRRTNDHNTLHRRNHVIIHSSTNTIATTITATATGAA